MIGPAINQSRKPRRVLIVVENLPVPFDRRVWSEATTLAAAGYSVAIICPKAKGFEASEETLEGIRIYRHPLPIQARGVWAYLLEYSAALFWQLLLSVKVYRKHGFDVIHACNPPDTIFIVGAFYKLLGKRFLFDHHDVCPEFYEAKFERKGFFLSLLKIAERLTFAVADVSIATNESYKKIALTRGKMPPDRVFVVRSGPDLTRVKRTSEESSWRAGRKYLVGYVGVIGQAEAVDLLLMAVDHIVTRLGRADVQFVIVGSGPELDALRTLTKTMMLQEFVTFTGRVDDQTLFTILTTADICVNPDKVNDYNSFSTMNKIMEYMALGKPIVQFDVIEGRFSAQAASVYAKPNDPVSFAEEIVGLLDDPQHREAMGQFGRRRVEEVLAWHHEQPKLLAAYDELFSIGQP